MGATSIACRMVGTIGMGPDNLSPEMSERAIKIGEELISVAEIPAGMHEQGTWQGAVLNNRHGRRVVAQLLGSAYIDCWRLMNVNKEAIDQAAEALIAQGQLAAHKPAGLAETIRRELAVAAATFAFRQAARQEQLRVYELAGYANVQSSVLPLLPPGVQGPLNNAIAGLHSLYILGGIDQYYLVNPHFTLAFSNAAPLASLRSYYVGSQNTYGIHASYLASSSFIERKCGRVDGPSSAGALGPMQFLPSTWANYGNGGIVLDPA